MRSEFKEKLYGDDDDLYAQIFTRPDFVTSTLGFQAAVDELREQICYDFFQQTQVLSVWISSKGNGNYYSFRMPIYASQTKLLDYFGLADGETLRRVYADNAAKDIASGYSLTGYTVDTQNNLIVNTAESSQEIWEICYASAVINWGRYSIGDPFFLTAVDASCFFRDNNHYGYLYFLAGQIPAAVRTLFASGK